MKKAFFLAFYFWITLCSAQSIASIDDITDSKRFLLEVKQLDQFIKRFNNEEDILTGNEKTAEEITANRKDFKGFQLERKKILMSLFNLGDSSLFNKTTREFVNFIGNDTDLITISYYDPDWYAAVNCTMNYKGKNFPVILTMKNEGSYKSGFKWIIESASPDFFKSTSSHKDSTKSIGPMNHELGFMGLFNVFNDAKNITEYTSKNFIPDNFSVFLFLVKSGEIKYVQVNSVKYHFLQLKNWIFTVEYFNRNDNNSGWLISSLFKVSDSEKMNYRKKNLSLR